MLNAFPLVSVIIPAYNVEKYLEETIQSVRMQGYGNLEIVIVNDGSTDASPAIISKYAAIDARIKRVDKENEGLPFARKSGIEVASGKYILHLDGDDTLAENIVTELVMRAEETDADIVVGPLFFVSADKGAVCSLMPSFDAILPDQYYMQLLSQQAYWSVTANFQKASLYKDYTVDFVKDISYGEDAILMTQLVLNAKKIVSIQRPIFNYIQHQNSMTHTIENAKSYSYLTAFRFWIENYLATHGLDKKFEKGLAALHIHNTFECVYFRCFEFLSKDMRKIKEDLCKYPELIEMLDSRKRKLVRLYGISKFLGNWKLHKYIKANRI